MQDTPDIFLNHLPATTKDFDRLCEHINYQIFHRCSSQRYRKGSMRLTVGGAGRKEYLCDTCGGAWDCMWFKDGSEYTNWISKEFCVEPYELVYKMLYNSDKGYYYTQAMSKTELEDYYSRVHKPPDMWKLFK